MESPVLSHTRVPSHIPCRVHKQVNTNKLEQHDISSTQTPCSHFLFKDIHKHQINQFECSPKMKFTLLTFATMDSTGLLENHKWVKTSLCAKWSIWSVRVAILLMHIQYTVCVHRCISKSPVIHRSSIFFPTASITVSKKTKPALKRQKEGDAGWETE